MSSNNINDWLLSFNFTANSTDCFDEASFLSKYDCLTLAAARSFACHAASRAFFFSSIFLSFFEDFLTLGGLSPDSTLTGLLGTVSVPKQLESFGAAASAMTWNFSKPRFFIPPLTLKLGIQLCLINHGFLPSNIAILEVVTGTARKNPSAQKNARGRSEQRNC